MNDLSKLKKSELIERLERAQEQLYEMSTNSTRLEEINKRL